MLPLWLGHDVSGLLRGIRLLFGFNVVKQVEHVHSEGVRNDLNGIQRRISLTGFDPAQVGLIEATHFTKLNLAHSGPITQGAYAGAKLLRQSCFHDSEYLSYAPNHINTNSYKSVCRR